MLPPRRLASLHPAHRVRKAALLFQEAERAMHSADPLEAASARAYAFSLAAFLAADTELSEPIRSLAASLLATGESEGEGAPGPEERRRVNLIRHLLLRESGQAPADWDFLSPFTGLPDKEARRVLPGMRAYLEDVRSPFNIGSILRTSDAFGLEELILSPHAADPAHPRAARSSMGALDLVPWRRAGLEALEEAVRGGEAVFALELGGEALEDFSFPEKGIVVLGSEELGVSTEALALCGGGRVSIPMSGAKASLNVGVAFGILLYAWSSRRGRPSFV